MKNNQSGLKKPRKKWFLAIVAILIVVGALLQAKYAIHQTKGFVSNPDKRFYKKGTPQLSREYKYVTYDFMSDNSFQNGKMWIQAYEQAGKSHNYLYNLETNQIEGESSYWLLYNENLQAGLFVKREVILPKTRIYLKIYEFLSGIGLHARNPRTQPVEYLFQSGLENNAVRLGTTHEVIGAAGGRQVSPSLKHIRVWTTTDEHLLFSMVPPCMTYLPRTKDWRGGCWSDNELIYFAPNGDLMIYNIKSGSESSLLTFAQIRQTLGSYNIVLSPSEYIMILSAWREDQYEFYLADNYMKTFPKTSKSWLVKIDKSSKQLIPVSKAFPFARTGHLDGMGNYYVSSGELETGNSNAVYLFDAKTSKTRTLVPANAGEKQFSLPNFYKDRIIYKQKGAIWSIKIDGSEQIQLFPPK